VTKTVEGLGGSAQQYEQIEKASAHARRTRASSASGCQGDRAVEAALVLHRPAQEFADVFLGQGPKLGCQEA
jgi:hypothetical protein